MVAQINKKDLIPAYSDYLHILLVTEAAVISGYAYITDAECAVP
jgi:hypothetical protein